MDFDACGGGDLGCGGSGDLLDSEGFGRAEGDGVIP